ncbi:hypothetical protein TRVA0_027S01398 [Trichomonascus vanleenenianus]|uniref:uncharacterized protein n=1 Tax=Trichomonascus vanleenenianus TaxID=2268995 RepID=UPI003EC9B62B
MRERSYSDRKPEHMDALGQPPPPTRGHSSEGEIQGLSEAYASALLETGFESTRPKRKRRRIPASCETCRQRKLKCDRNHPCGSCVALGSPSCCKYQTKEEVFQKFAEKNSTTTSSNNASSGSSTTLTNNSTTPNPAVSPSYPLSTITTANSDALLMLDAPAPSGFQLPPDGPCQSPLSQLLDSHSQFRPFSQDPFRPIDTTVGTTIGSAIANSVANEVDPICQGGPNNRIYDQQRLNLFYKPVLTVSHEGIVQFRPGYHCPLPPADEFVRQLHNRFNFRLNAILSRTVPLAVDAHRQNQADVIDEFTLRMRSPQRRSNAWLQILLEFVPQSPKVCDFLVERFLLYVNSLFHAVSPTQLRNDLSELLLLRQSSIDDLTRLHALPKQFSIFSEYIPLSHDYSVVLKTDQIHKIGLLLMVFYFARKTLPDDWECRGLVDLLKSEVSSSEAAEAYAERTYLGEGLQTLAACGVKLTSLHHESTIPLIQTLCYICVNKTVLGSDELDSRHRISGRQMVANLVQCALAIGLQRDPDGFYASSNIPMKNLRRQLWRQVLFLDTLSAVQNATSPLANLQFSDVDLSRYEPLYDEDYLNDELGQRAEETFTRLALTCRKAYDDLLMSARNSAPRMSVESLDAVLSRFSVTPSSGAHHEAVSRIARILIGEQRLCLEKIFVVASSTEEAVRHVLRSALPVLDQEKACRYNLHSPFDYVLSSVALRAGHIARTSIVMSLAMPGIMASGYRLGSDSRSYASILHEIQLCQEWLASQSHRYLAWSDYHYISAALSCIAELAPGKAPLDGGDQKNLAPLSSKWVYKLLSELF